MPLAHLKPLGHLICTPGHRIHVHWATQSSDELRLHPHRHMQTQSIQTAGRAENGAGSMAGVLGSMRCVTQTLGS